MTTLAQVRERDAKYGDKGGDSFASNDRRFLLAQLDEAVALLRRGKAFHRAEGRKTLAEDTDTFLARLEGK